MLNSFLSDKCEKGGKMLSIFSKKGQFDAYQNKLSKMTDKDFANAELMKKVSAEFDIYEE